MDNVDFFVKFFETQPPYKKSEISLREYSRLSEYEDFRIEGYCSCCEKERTFLAKDMNKATAPLRHHLLINTPAPGASHNTGPESYPSEFIGILFNCAHCGEEHFFAIRIDAQSICKVGQYPSFSRLVTQDLEKYKNLLKKYYIELISAVKLYSQNLGIGSFVYLRRILEHLIETKYDKLLDSDKRAKFMDKLTAVEKVENVIPKGLDPIKGVIYSILSKGVHEYTEEECLDLFEPALVVITSILDQELVKKEQAKKEKQVAKIITSVLSK